MSWHVAAYTKLYLSPKKRHVYMSWVMSPRSWHVVVVKGASHKLGGIENDVGQGGKEGGKAQGG